MVYEKDQFFFLHRKNSVLMIKTRTVVVKTNNSNVVSGKISAWEAKAHAKKMITKQIPIDRMIRCGWLNDEDDVFVCTSSLS